MNLQRLYVDINAVVFDEASYIDGHTLHINKEELETAVGDPAFASVEISIAKPGDSCRIVNMGDVVQPAVKLDDEDATFPGLVGRMRTAGSGQSLLLRGVVVSETVEVPIQLPSL